MTSTRTESMSALGTWVPVIVCGDAVGKVTTFPATTSEGTSLENTVCAVTSVVLPSASVRIPDIVTDSPWFTVVRETATLKSTSS
jgi:hypothetical protein